MGNNTSMETSKGNFPKSSPPGTPTNNEDNSFASVNKGPWESVEMEWDEYWFGFNGSVSRCWPVVFQMGLQAYESSLYALAINTIEANFFSNSTIAAWACYAVPYLVNPIGGLVGGYLSDTYGRRIVITTSAYGMVVSTVAQGLIPAGTGALGIAALIVLRIFQGLSYGNTASMKVYVMEMTERPKLIQAALLLGLGAALGAIASSALYAVLEELLDTATMYRWGWRLPYLLILIPGIISANACFQMPESSEFQQNRREEGVPICEALGKFGHQWDRNMMCMGLMVAAYGLSIGSSYIVSWMPEYTVITESFATWLVFFNSGVTIMILPLAAYWSDTLGPSRVLLVAGTITMVGLPPLFALTLYGPNPYAAGVVMAVCFGISSGLLVSLVAVSTGLYPTETRAMSTGVLQNVSYCLVVGLSPTLLAWLCQYDAMAPAYFLAAAQLVGISSVVTLQYLRAQGETVSYLRDRPF